MQHTYHPHTKLKQLINVILADTNLRQHRSISLKPCESSNTLQAWSL